MVRLKIKEIAEEKKMSMGKLCRSSDVSYTTIKMVYREPYRDVTLGTLEKLAKALGVSICDLFEEEK